MLGNSTQVQGHQEQVLVHQQQALRYQQQGPAHQQQGPTYEAARAAMQKMLGQEKGQELPLVAHIAKQHRHSFMDTVYMDGSFSQSEMQMLSDALDLEPLLREETQHQIANASLKKQAAAAAPKAMAKCKAKAKASPKANAKSGKSAKDDNDDQDDDGSAKVTKGAPKPPGKKGAPKCLALTKQEMADRKRFASRAYHKERSKVLKNTGCKIKATEAANKAIKDAYKKWAEDHAMDV